MTRSRKRLSPPRCQNLPALESAASTASLRRQQHGIDAGIRNLLRHELPVAHVALQRRAVPWKEYNDHARFADIEILRDMHENPVIVVGLVLPKNLAPRPRWPRRSPFVTLRNGSSVRGLLPR